MPSSQFSELLQHSNPGRDCELQIRVVKQCLRSSSKARGAQHSGVAGPRT